MATVFKEISEAQGQKYSAYLRFVETRKSALASTSEDEKAESPKLSFLRIELERIRTGMSDFIIRVATPEYAGIKSNTILSIRGSRALTKYDRVRTLANVIIENMQQRGDKTHDWENANADHLADLLVSSLKYFAINSHTDSMRFTTEALS